MMSQFTLYIFRSAETLVSLLLWDASFCGEPAPSWCEVELCSFVTSLFHFQKSLEEILNHLRIIFTVLPGAEERYSYATVMA